MITDHFNFYLFYLPGAICVSGMTEGTETSLVVTASGFDPRLLQLSAGVDQVWSAAVNTVTAGAAVAQLPLGLVVMRDRLSLRLRSYSDLQRDEDALSQLRSGGLLSLASVRSVCCDVLLVCRAACDLTTPYGHCI